ncbi:hypothetical protein D3C72_1353280 [compost metagenome]
MQRVLPAVPAAAPVAVHAADFVQAPVQIDDVLAAGGRVQAVHVLRDQNGHVSARFQAGQRAVRGIRLHLSKAAPAHHAACPVARPGQVRAHEGLQRHGRLALPFAVGVAVVGDAGVSADARSRQHEQPRVAVDEPPQRGQLRDSCVHPDSFFAAPRRGGCRAREDGVQPPSPQSGMSLTRLACVTLLPGATLRVSQTLPPMVDPLPIVTRPRIVAPA